MIADANFLRIDVRMKHRRGHPAEWRATRVIEWQKNLRAMDVVELESTLRGGNDTVDIKFEDVFLGWSPFDPHDPDIGMLGEHRRHSLVVGVQSANAWCHVSLFPNSYDIRISDFSVHYFPNAA